MKNLITFLRVLLLTFCITVPGSEAFHRPKLSHLHTHIHSHFYNHSRHHSLNDQPLRRLVSPVTANMTSLTNQTQISNQSALNPATGLKSAVYFVNWGIYARNYTPQQLPASQFTHILYAFANVNNVTGEAYLSDTNADTDKHFAGDSWNDIGTNVYGCVKQLFKLKKANRKLKTLLSIGGYTYGKNFAAPMATPAGRNNFIKTAVGLLEDLGFDGLDIDWEFPNGAADAANFVSLLSSLRTALDAAAARRGNQTHFYLTAAVPAGPSNYKQLDVAGMDQYLDFWNLMAYDYAGSWSTMAGHASNLNVSSSMPKSTPYNSITALNFYLGKGVAPKKMVLGMPMYGRAFQNTAGPGTNYTGLGSGSWEPGIWDYKVLPQAGAQMQYDSIMGASWSYNPSNRSMVTFDNEDVARTKAIYVKSQGLGGGMWWESSGDKPFGKGSLVEAFLNASGGNATLDQSQNCLLYPYSKYANLRSGM